MTNQSMLRMNYLAVIVAAVAAFMAGLVWYAVFGNAWMELRGIESATAADTGTPAWTMLFVGIQSLVVAFMLAAIHAGDWLVKLLLKTVILGAWRKGHHPAPHRISR